MSRIHLLFITLLISTFAHADLLSLRPGPTAKNGVNISLGATAMVDGKSFDLTTVGSGLRSKRVVFDIPVYIVEVMVMDQARYVKTEAGALASLDSEGAIALRLTFLRDVGSDKIATSFQDGLDANSVDPKDADIVHFMDIVGKTGDAKTGGSLTIFFTKGADGSEVLAYENIRDGKPSLKVIKGLSGFSRKIFSIWLGASADSGLAKLKTELMK